MKYIFCSTLIFLFSFFLITPQLTYAIEDPLKASNNNVGIHILFPGELEQAEQLINSSGGDWGYVTIPIQVGDKDLEKWNTFMHLARKIHVIPIIRLATEGDYFNTKVWRKPNESDVLDFANFLNSLDWPTKNRYIIVFNEVNRGDEWGGIPNASEYAQLLKYVVEIFKSRSDDFFIISAGFDNASINVQNTSVENYTFIRQMQNTEPDIFNRIDGISSHSYPNPGFSRPPTDTAPVGTSTFIYEQDLINSLSGRKLPVFITETGWSRDEVPEKLIDAYYKSAFSGVWKNDSIVAITPFLLSAATRPFSQFSFLNADGSKTSEYNAYRDMAKIKGSPTLNAEVESAKTYLKSPLRLSSNKKDSLTTVTIEPIKIIFKWLLNL